MRERDYLFRGVQIMPVIKARPPAQGLAAAAAAAARDGNGRGQGGGGEGMRAICILDQAYFLKNARDRASSELASARDSA
jgi:L-aminopeptidase/D-esterase-like protein